VAFDRRSAPQVGPTPRRRRKADTENTENRYGGFVQGNRVKPVQTKARQQFHHPLR